MRVRMAGRRVADRRIAVALRLPADGRFATASSAGAPGARGEHLQEKVAAGAEKGLDQILEALLTARSLDDDDVDGPGRGAPAARASARRRRQTWTRAPHGGRARRHDVAVPERRGPERRGPERRRPSRRRPERRRPERRRPGARPVSGRLRLGVVRAGLAEAGGAGPGGVGPPSSPRRRRPRRRRPRRRAPRRRFVARGAPGPRQRRRRRRSASALCDAARPWLTLDEAIEWNALAVDLIVPLGGKEMGRKCGSSRAGAFRLSLRRVGQRRKVRPTSSLFRAPGGAGAGRDAPRRARPARRWWRRRRRERRKARPARGCRDVEMRDTRCVSIGAPLDTLERPRGLPRRAGARDAPAPWPRAWPRRGRPGRRRRTGRRAPRRPSGPSTAPSSAPRTEPPPPRAPRCGAAFRASANAIGDVLRLRAVAAAASAAAASATAARTTADGADAGRAVSWATAAAGGVRSCVPCAAPRRAAGAPPPDRPAPVDRRGAPASLHRGGPVPRPRRWTRAPPPRPTGWATRSGFARRRRARGRPAAGPARAPVDRHRRSSGFATLSRRQHGRHGQRQRDGLVGVRVRRRGPPFPRTPRARRAAGARGPGPPAVDADRWASAGSPRRRRGGRPSGAAAVRRGRAATHPPSAGSAIGRETRTSPPRRTCQRDPLAAPRPPRARRSADAGVPPRTTSRASPGRRRPPGRGSGAAGGSRGTRPSRFLGVDVDHDGSGFEPARSPSRRPSCGASREDGREERRGRRPRGPRRVDPRTRVVRGARLPSDRRAALARAEHHRRRRVGTLGGSPRLGRGTRAGCPRVSGSRSTSQSPPRGVGGARAGVVGACGADRGPRASLPRRGACEPLPPLFRGGSGRRFPGLGSGRRVPRARRGRRRGAARPRIRRFRIRPRALPRRSARTAPALRPDFRLLPWPRVPPFENDVGRDLLERRRGAAGGQIAAEKGPLGDNTLAAAPAFVLVRIVLVGVVVLALALVARVARAERRPTGQLDRPRPHQRAAAAGPAPRCRGRDATRRSSKEATSDATPTTVDRPEDRPRGGARDRVATCGIRGTPV